MPARHSPAAPGPRQRAEAAFTERLWVPWWWWAVAVPLVALLGAEVHLGLGPVAAVVTYLVLGAATAAFLLRWATRTRVDTHGLQAGGRHVPLSRVTAVTTLRRDEARRLPAVRPDASAVVLLRGYVPDAVYVGTDGRGGTPGYLLLSTRRPGELTAALGDRVGAGHAPPAGHDDMPSATLSEYRDPAIGGDTGMGKKKPDLGWTIVGGLSAFAAGFATRKLLELTWTKTTGNKPPETPESPDVAFREAVAWAIATGVAVGVAKLVVTREAAKAWRKATGDLPAAFREIEEKLD